MKIAILSDLYPPYFVGGYEIGMSWIANELRERNHEVHIFHAREFNLIDQNGRLVRMTHPRRGYANFDIGPGISGWVRAYIRRNPIRGFWLVWLIACARLNLYRFRRALRERKYDLIIMGNPQGLLAPFYEVAAEYGSRNPSTRVGLFVSDHWVAAWPKAYPLRHLSQINALPPSFKVRGPRSLVMVLAWRVLRYGKLNGWLYKGLVDTWFLDFAACCSKYIAQISQPRLAASANIDVAHWGLPLKQFDKGYPLPDFTSKSLTIAYAGQIEEHKGLSTLISAVAKSSNAQDLVVIGDDTTLYALQCKSLAASLGISDRIKFAGKVSQEEVLDIFSRCHLLVVPSEWEEPYAIVPLQGKLCGLVTIVSDTGGSKEGIQSEIDGFLFEARNADQLSQLLDRLHYDRDLCKRVSSAAYFNIREEGTISNTVDKILAIAGRSE
jgi:glycosyltransferase involved in cell wall biosynthesis